MVKRFAALLLSASLPASIAAAHATPVNCSERLLPSSPRTATGSRPVTARDLVELRDFGRADAGGSPDAFSISPDGRFAALTLRRADIASNGYCIGVVLIPLDEKSPPRLLDMGGELILGTTDVFGIEGVVTGTVRPGTPVWSPDGKRLAFLRRDQGVTQAWVVGLDGRAARPLTHLPSDVLSVAWTVNGSSLRITSRPALRAGMAAIDREAPNGFLYDERFRLSADTRPHPLAPLPVLYQAVDPATGAVRDLDKADSADAAPPPGADLLARSEAGQVAWTALEDPGRPFGSSRLHLQARGREIECTAAICHDRISGLWWRHPGELILMRAGSPANGGRIALYRWRIGLDPAPDLLFETVDSLASCQLRGASMLCAAETASKPRRLVRLDLESGKTRTVFDPNPEFASLAMGLVRRIIWADRDGVPSYGDLVLPPDHKPGERHPLVIVQYLSRGFLRGGTGDEYPIHLLAAHGFAVLSFQKPDPLPAMLAAGGTDEAQRINVSGWAERRRIFGSLDAGIDAAIATGSVDGARIGITGFSDGGSTLQFALVNSTRFMAAATSSCCDDPGVMFALGPSYAASAARWGYPPPGEDGREFWRPQSLALAAGRIRVPLLLQVSDAEVRGAAEAFAALKAHGAPVEMYVFADENHIKSHPVHRLAIYSRSVAWFDYWLRGVRTADPARQAELGRWDAMRPRHSD